MINEIVDKIIPKVIEYRRHFHQFPELSFEEFETSEFIAEKLRELGYSVRTNIGGTGVMAMLHGAQEPDSYCVALRADYDARGNGIQDFRPDKELIQKMVELID